LREKDRGASELRKPREDSLAGRGWVEGSRGEAPIVYQDVGGTGTSELVTSSCGASEESNHRAESSRVAEWEEGRI
jgi:hypothetical protein